MWGFEYFWRTLPQNSRDGLEPHFWPIRLFEIFSSVARNGKHNPRITQDSQEAGLPNPPQKVRVKFLGWIPKTTLHFVWIEGLNCSEIIGKASDDSLQLKDFFGPQKRFSKNFLVSLTIGCFSKLMVCQIYGLHAGRLSRKRQKFTKTAKRGMQLRQLQTIGEKLKGRSLKGSFDKACALTCRFLCRSPPHPPPSPSLSPFPSFSKGKPPPTTPWTRPQTPPPGTPIGTRTPLWKLPPVKTTL